MANAVVRIDDLERGDLPAVSAKTGEPCANPVAVTLRAGGGLFSLRGRRVKAIVPLEPHVVKARAMLTRVSWVVLGLFVVAFVVSLVWPGLAMFAVVAALFVAYVVVVVVGDARWIGARMADAADEVELTHVHAAFARAVDEFSR